MESFSNLFSPCSYCLRASRADGKSLGILQKEAAASNSTSHASEIPGEEGDGMSNWLPKVSFSLYLPFGHASMLSKDRQLCPYIEDPSNEHVHCWTKINSLLHSCVNICTDLKISAMLFLFWQHQSKRIMNISINSNKKILDQVKHEQPI